MKIPLYLGFKLPSARCRCSRAVRLSSRVSVRPVRPWPEFVVDLAGLNGYFEGEEGNRNRRERRALEIKRCGSNDEFNSDFESICDPDGDETDDGVMG